MKTHISMLSGVGDVTTATNEVLQRASYAETKAPRTPLNLDDTTGQVVLTQMRRQVQLIGAANPEMKAISQKALQLIERSMTKGKSIHDTGALKGIGAIPTELNTLMGTLAQLQMMTAPAIQAPASLRGVPSASSRPINLLSVIGMSNSDYTKFAAKLAVILRLNNTSGILSSNLPASAYGTNVGASVVPSGYTQSVATNAIRSYSNKFVTSDGSFDSWLAWLSYNRYLPNDLISEINSFVDKIFVKYGAGLAQYRMERIEVIKRLYEACKPQNFGLQLGSWQQATSTPFVGEWYLNDGKTEADFLAYMRGPINQKWFNDRCNDDLALGGLYTYIDTTTARAGVNGLSVQNLPNIAQTKAFAQSTFMNNINLFSGVNPAIISTQFRNGIIAKTTKQPEAVLQAHLYDNAAALYRSQRTGVAGMPNVGLDPVTVTLIIGIVGACMAAVPGVIAAANGMAVDANGIDQNNVNPPNLPSNSIYNQSDWPNPLPQSGGGSNGGQNPSTPGQSTAGGSSLLIPLGLAAGAAYLLSQK